MRFVVIKESQYTTKRMAIAKKFSMHKPGRTFAKRAQAQKLIQKLKKSKEKQESEKPFKGYNKNRHSRTGGLNDKFRKKYNKENGSNLKRPVTQKNPGPKAKARRKSFCARMRGVPGATSKDGKLTPKGAALKKWRCGSS